MTEHFVKMWQQKQLNCKVEKEIIMFKKLIIATHNKLHAKPDVLGDACME